MRHLVVTLVIKINFFLLFTVNGNSGICLPSADCSTVISPTRGTCSSGTSHICCFEEAPDDVNSDAVAMVLTTMTQVSFNGKMNSRLLLNSRLPEDRTLVYQKLRFWGV